MSDNARVKMIWAKSCMLWSRNRTGFSTQIDAEPFEKQKHSTLYTRASNLLIHSEIWGCRVGEEWCRDSTPR